MTDPLTYLDEVDARAEAATEGPWLPYSTGSSLMDNYVTTPGLDGVAMHYALVWKPGDAEFIAHARQDLPALSKALRLVLDTAAIEATAADTSAPLGEYPKGWFSGWNAAMRRVEQAIQAALAVNDEGGEKE